MSLEFIWINKFKCFQGNPFGFNLTGRFIISFDGKNLKIEENDNYLSHPQYLFGCDSPVTDCSILVGGNGSGKTSIFSLIFNAFINGSIDGNDTKYLILFLDKNKKWLCKTNVEINVENNPIQIINNSFSISNRIASIYYSPLFSTEHPLNEVLNNDTQFDISTTRLLCDDIKEFDNEAFSTTCKNSQVTGHKRIDTKRIITFLYKCEKDDCFQPIKECLKDFYPKSIIIQPREPSDFFKAEYKDLKTKNNQITNLLDFFKSSVRSLHEKICASLLTEFITAHYKPENGNDFGFSKKTSARINELIKSKKNFTSAVSHFFNELAKDIKDLGFSDNSFNIRAIISFINYTQNICRKYDNNSYLIFKGDKLGSLLEIYHKYTETQPIKDYLELFLAPHISSGEYCQLSLFSRLYCLFSEQAAKLEKMDIILCLDEIETTMHPLLQKKAVYQVIDFLDKLLRNLKINAQCHIIFSTHSPLLLSDFQWKNVVRLNKGEYIKNDMKTFASNIYDLYKDSFFFKDGAIGEFATRLIKKAIETKEESATSEIVVNEIADYVLHIMVKENIEQKGI